MSAQRWETPRGFHVVSVPETRRRHMFTFRFVGGSSCFLSETAGAIAHSDAEQRQQSQPYLVMAFTHIHTVLRQEVCVARNASERRTERLAHVFSS